MLKSNCISSFWNVGCLKLSIGSLIVSCSKSLIFCSIFYCKLSILGGNLGNSL